MLVDRAVSWLPSMSESSGYQAREALDKDLDEAARRLEAEMRVPPVVPTFPQQSVFHVFDRPAAAGEPQPVRRRSDQLRATWGLHVESEESRPGGVSA